MKQLAAEHGIPYTTLTHWRYRFCQQDSDARGKEASTKLVPVKIKASPQSPAPIELHTPFGHTLHIPTGFCAETFGRRVKTVVGAVETEMLYHGWHMIGAFEKKVSGNEWLWQEVPMSRGEGMIEHVALDANTAEYLGYAVHEDWQNTVWALSNTSAVVVERYVQDDPFGKSHTLDASGNNLGNYASQVHHHKRMHGGVVEEVTGLYDFRNRWYSPESGSWLSRDPLGYRDSFNLYQAVYSNPILWQDAFGLSCRAPVIQAKACKSRKNINDPNMDEYMWSLCNAKAECECWTSCPGLGQTRGDAIILYYYLPGGGKRRLPLEGEENSRSSIPWSEDCVSCGDAVSTFYHEGLHLYCDEWGGADCGHPGVDPSDPVWWEDVQEYDDLAREIAWCISDASTPGGGGSSCAEAGKSLEEWKDKHDF